MECKLDYGDIIYESGDIHIVGDFDGENSIYFSSGNLGWESYNIRDGDLEDINDPEIDSFYFIGNSKLLAILYGGKNGSKE